MYVGKQIYAYWDLKKAETGLDYNALATDLESRITSATTSSEYYLLLRRWAAAFHDGHVNVLMKDDRSDLEIYSAGIRLETLAPATERESLIVSQSSEPDVKIGDVLLEVNGVSVSEALTAQEREVSGSTARMRRSAAASRIVDSVGIEDGSKTLKLKLKRGSAEAFEVEIARTAILNSPGSGPLGTSTSGADLFKATLLPGNIAYLRIDGFAGENSRELLQQAAQRLSRAAGLIIDLRKNGGGDQSGSVILAQIAGRAIERYQVSESLNPFLIHARPEYFGLTPDGETGFAQWHPVTVQAPQQSAVFQGKPVFAITSPRCFSACDTFVAGLNANGLGKIFGEGTGGGTGTPLVFELPESGHRFRYSVVRGRTAQGKTIEGQGTLPDVFIEPLISDRSNNTDSQLAQVIGAMSAELKIASQNSASVSESAARIVTQFGAVSDQSLEVAPTIVEDMILKTLSQAESRNW